MKKTYFNNAVVGNSSMLGCITDKGELVRLYWPNIDYPQHIEKMNIGIFFNKQKNSTMWLNEGCFQHTQQYIDDTNILMTICENAGIGIKVTQIDFVVPEKDVLIRHYNIENKGTCTLDMGLMLYSSGITSTSEIKSSLFDFTHDTLIHYRHGYYMALCADRQVYQFQLGNGAYESAKCTHLNGYENIGIMNDGAVSWQLGNFEPGEEKSITINICAAHSLKEVKKLVDNIKKSEFLQEYNNTKKYWDEFLTNSKYSNYLSSVDKSKNNIAKLFKRSLLVFKLMSDKNTGGLLASPEIDEEFTKCGRYAYCWGRDAAFITSSLDRSGFTDEVDKFYKWAVETQSDDGSWHQRYYMDGNLAPSWGLQVDETGTIIWGMLEHYNITKSKGFLESMWDGVKKGIQFMLEFVDDETGLPRPSHDLWEERLGEHAYSSAAVYSGIKAGIEIAGILNAGEINIDKWQDAANKFKAAIQKNFWKEDCGRFIRSIRTKLNPWGCENSPDSVLMEVNPKGYCRDFTLEDAIVDVSLLGLSVPFDVFDVNDARIKNTVNAIEFTLTSPVIGGIKRYENDSYMGGNPWVLATLWVALYHIRCKNYVKARDYLEWVVKYRTSLNLLPEQINKDNGEPAWVVPLTWSHAMFVLATIELLEAGQL